MNKKTFGALKRIIKEVKEKRTAKCFNIDRIINHRIGGNDIELVETWIKENGDINITTGRGLEEIDKDIITFLERRLNAKRI